MNYGNRFTYKSKARRGKTDFLCTGSQTLFCRNTAPFFFCLCALCTKVQLLSGRAGPHRPPCALTFSPFCAKIIHHSRVSKQRPGIPGPPPRKGPCILPQNMIKYLKHPGHRRCKPCRTAPCCAVWHTDAGPVRLGRCEPGQVGNQAALSGVHGAFQPACIRMPCFARRGSTPQRRPIFLSLQRRCGYVSCALPQMAAPAL